jgi:putative SOS response-associated peptidase YedK
MCGRYSIILPPEAIRELFRTYGELPNWPAWYNAAPTTALSVVRQAKDGGNREIVLMQWGLIPWFSKDGKPSFSTINARAEGLRTAAPYKEPFAKGRRCIVPASGYFEWTGPKYD